MPQNPQPSPARRAYKAFIDALVEDTRQNLCDRLVCDDGLYRDADGYDDANALVASMSDEQRRVLAGILLDQRMSAVGSALALLDWKLGDDIVVLHRGHPVPFDQCEGGPHGDYLARCGGWQWLDQETEDTGARASEEPHPP
ncbi:MAG TPA: DUF6547 family protein [Humisphaera sp.]